LSRLLMHSGFQTTVLHEHPAAPSTASKDAGLSIPLLIPGCGWSTAAGREAGPRAPGRSACRFAPGTIRVIDRPATAANHPARAHKSAPGPSSRLASPDARAKDERTRSQDPLDPAPTRVRRNWMEEYWRRRDR
jgi:hypothetical protein